MTREGALLIITLVALAIIAVLVWAWMRRTRRDAKIQAPVGEAPTKAHVVATFTSLYVATTRHDEPLERLAIRGLDFRSRADVTVTSAGVAVDLTGKPRVFFATDVITHVAQATVTIDRVVERDGLVCLSWRTNDGTVVDSYFRPQDTSARSLADTISGILTPSQIGTDA
ncbi:PH-like domain-containing protein (plasmid) [Coraliomargarita sp. W4R53]